MTDVSVNKGEGTLQASTQMFSLKSAVDENGSEREFVEGFLATTHIDKGNDEFTKNALKQMADDINGEDVDAHFYDVDEEKLREAQHGNFDHASNPASPFGDTRTVPAFKIQRAEIKETSDGETGLWIKAVLNTGGMLDETVSAVKNSIKDDFLNAFSIEFIPEKVRKVKRNNRVIRVIEAAAAKGAAITGRPMNPAAAMTDAMLKSMNTEIKVDYLYDVGDEVSWNQTSGTVRDRTKDSCFNERIDGDQEICGEEEDPAYLIEVDNDEGTMVAHKQSLFSEKTNTKQLSEEKRTPPQAAQDNAQMALDAKEETGNPNDCGTETGWKRARQLADGGALSMDVIQKMAQFNRHRDNSEMSDEEGEADCGWMMWKAWGGDEGVDWAVNLSDENKTDYKTDFTPQTPEYSATGKGSWSKPAMEDFPEDYDVMTIFLARDTSSDNFGDQALPVVDYRNGEATLVLEGLRSAHQMASRVDGMSEDEVESVRAKARNLADDEFDVMLGQEKNDITPMTEDEQVPEEEGDEPESEGDNEEVKSLSEDIKELKTEFEDVKETNEELRERNESLKSELEDLKTLQNLKSDLDEVKNLVEDIELEDGPRVEQDQKRETETDSREGWQKTIDGMQNPNKFLEGNGKSTSMLDAFVEGKNVSKEEVKNYVKD